MYKIIGDIKCPGHRQCLFGPEYDLRYYSCLTHYANTCLITRKPNLPCESAVKLTGSAL